MGFSSVMMAGGAGRAGSAVTDLLGSPGAGIGADAGGVAGRLSALRCGSAGGNASAGENTLAGVAA